MEEIQSIDSTLTLKNRNQLSLSGVSKVEESSDNKIILKIANSGVLILGTNLQVKKIDVLTGTFEAEGVVTEIKFLNKPQKGNFFKRLFK